jgi:hypothetical protein
MGIIGNALQRVRELTRGDKEFVRTQLSAGNTISGAPGSGFDLLQAYGYDVLSDYLRLDHDLMSRFVDYEEMDDYPEISAALDIYADDATVTDTQRNRAVWIESADETVQQALDDLFHRRLRLDEEIREIARTTVKYGNDYEEMLVTEDGVVGLQYLAVPTVRRVEGPRGELYGFVQDFKGRSNYSPVEFQEALAARFALGTGALNGALPYVAMEDWEVVHFRLKGKQRRSLYGYSVMEPCRWIWKRLMMLEDAALIYRLQRAPERYAFYVDTGDLPPKEALAYVNQCRQMYRKKKFFNPSTGRVDLRNNPLGQDEDFFVPVRKGSEAARIEVLGAPSWQHMDDIEYFRDKLFAGMKVPKAYLAQEADVARAVLSSEDVRFAMAVLSVQQELRAGISKIGRVHLAATGVDPNQVEFDVRMTVPSSIFELAQIEVMTARAELAGRMGDYVSAYWIMSSVFKLNDGEIETITKQRKEDAVAAAVLQAEAAVAAEKTQQRLMPSSDSEGPTEALRRPLILPPSVQGLTEQQLLRGNRDMERRLGDQLDELRAGDRKLDMKLRGIQQLLDELRLAGAYSSNGRQG